MIESADCQMRATSGAVQFEFATLAGNGSRSSNALQQHTELQVGESHQDGMVERSRRIIKEALDKLQLATKGAGLPSHPSRFMGKCGVHEHKVRYLKVGLLCSSALPR